MKKLTILASMILAASLQASELKIGEVTKRVSSYTPNSPYYSAKIGDEIIGISKASPTYYIADVTKTIVTPEGGSRLSISPLTDQKRAKELYELLVQKYNSQQSKK